jgi:hypothetical protein
MGMVTAIALFWSNKPNPAIEGQAKRRKKPHGWVDHNLPKKFNRSNHAHRHRLQILYQTQEKWAPESPALGS